MAATVEAATTRTCNKCGESKQLADFVKSARGPGGRGLQCRQCVNDYKRRLHNNQVAFRGKYEETDPAPAIRVGDTLAVCRRRGFAFDRAWDISLTAALADLRVRDRSDWEAALWSTRPAWQAGYERKTVAKVNLFVED